jgi:hypothetical protein
MDKRSLRQNGEAGGRRPAWDRRAQPEQDRWIDALAVDVLVAIGARDAAETPRPDSHTASEFSSAGRLGVLICIATNWVQPWISAVC